MKDSKRKVLNIFKKVGCICAALLAIVLLLAVALVISKILYYIVLYAVYAIVVFIVAIFWVKMMSKILRYIEQRNKK